MTDSPTTNKNLGQHWLKDQAILNQIVGYGDIQPTDTVLEIGPGPGYLTQLLVALAQHVVAVELDENLAIELIKRVTFANLTIEHQDIVRYNFSQLPAGYKIVANIPYYITSKVIRLLSETTNQPSRAVLLVQREVAERVAAQPGSMSLLSISAQYYWDVNIGIKVPAKFFIPPPKVDSQVLILTKRPKPLFGEIDTKLYFHIVRAGFSQRRKTLLNSLSGGLRVDKKTINEQCAAAGIDPHRRAQTLSLTEWFALYRAMV